MTALPFEYWNTLASQLIVISSLLAGFSLSLIFSLPDNKTKVTDYIFRLTTTATVSFLVSIFAMTKIFMMTNKGFPFKITGESLLLPRLIGGVSFFAGILSIIAILSLSGWARSESTKRFTIILGLLALLLIITMLA